MITVKPVRDEIVIATARTETAAIRAGRKHQREIHQSGGCAEGFNVYQDGKAIRFQRCNNFAEKWIDVNNKKQGWV